MHTSNIIAITFAALTAAAPYSIIAQNRSDTYYGVSINVNVATPGHPAIYEPAPIKINHLTSLGNNTAATELVFDHSVAVNVDLSKVECRAYKDQAGVVPGSAPFTNSTPAELSTNLVLIGSILCYITE